LLPGILVEIIDALPVGIDGDDGIDLSAMIFEK